MAYATFFSSLLIIYGPLLSLFLIVISSSSQLVILAIGGSFFWLLSILLSAILWYAVVPLRLTLAFIIPFATIIQEVGRFGFWKLLNKAYSSETFKNDPARPRSFQMAISVGWGIAMASALVLQTSVVWNALGYGDLPAPACPSVSVFSIHALVAVAMALLHIVLNVLTFDAYQRKSWLLIAFSGLTHLFISYISLLNEQNGSCLGSIIPVYATLVLACIVTWRVLLSSSNTLVRK